MLYHCFFLVSSCEEDDALSIVIHVSYISSSFYQIVQYLYTHCIILDKYGSKKYIFAFEIYALYKFTHSRIAKNSWSYLVASTLINQFSKMSHEIIGISHIN